MCFKLNLGLLLRTNIEDIIPSDESVPIFALELFIDLLISLFMYPSKQLPQRSLPLCSLTRTNLRGSLDLYLCLPL